MIFWIDPSCIDRVEAFGDSGDWIRDFQALELAMLPFFAAIYANCFSIKVFRLKHVANEIENTLKPMQIVLKGYMLFLVPIVGLVACIVQDWKVGLFHLVIGVVGFVSFYRKGRDEEVTAGS